MTEEDGKTDDSAPHLQRRPQLFEQRGSEIVDAPPQDIQVAEGYRASTHKGAWSDGKRLTLLTLKSSYRPDEEIRVVHVVESTMPGYSLYVAGPKAVYGEYVDGKLVTARPVNDPDPLVPLDDDGITLPSPAVDYNYEVTKYTLARHGTHAIRWKLGTLESNTLEILIANAV